MINKKKPKLITKIFNDKNFNYKLKFIIKKSKIINILNKKIKKILPIKIKLQCRISNFTKESIFIETLNPNWKIYIYKKKKKIINLIKKTKIKYIHVIINPNINI